MKTSTKQWLTLPPVFILIFIVFNSFTTSNRNSVANGAGIADGISFSFNAVEQKDGSVVGSIQYGDNEYIISWVKWMGKSAIFCTTDGHAFYVADNGKPSGADWISDPITAAKSDWLSSSDFYGLHCVASGNIQVKE